jgi:hypothetical protein
VIDANYRWGADGFSFGFANFLKILANQIARFEIKSFIALIKRMTKSSSEFSLDLESLDLLLRGQVDFKFILEAALMGFG